MKQNKFIITGTGRCGTTYTQAVLRVCGLNVTHQKYITFKNQQDLPDEVDGECSFMAVPYLKYYKDKGYTIIHLMRDLQEVLLSWQKRGVFMYKWEKFYPDFAKHAHKIAEGRDPSGWRIILKYWQREAELYADYTLHIDSVTNKPNLLFEAIGRPELCDEAMIKLIRTDANSDKC